ncbi:MAG: hypothetical protein J6R42_01130 [Clostridia bacterium]|nr:hypothetical protein [Clostridia bacterium]
MKRFLLACLVCVCLVVCLSLPVFAASSELPDVGEQTGHATGIFTELYKTVVGLATSIIAACATHSFLKYFLCFLACILLLAMATVGYRFFRVFAVGFGGLVGFVFGFSLCNIFGGPEWLMNISHVMNWIFAVLLMACGVVAAVLAPKLTTSMTLALSCTTALASVTSHAIFLVICFLALLTVFYFAMKSFFIPVTSVASSLAITLLLFGEKGLWPLAAFDQTLGLVDGVHSWMLLAILLSVVFMATSSLISRGTRYY